jgi:putative ABC transport system permease protein
MSFFHSAGHRLRALFRADEVARELDEEMRFHLDLDANHEPHDGLRGSEVYLASRRRFGNVTYYKEETRKMTGLALLDDIRQDLRYAMRMLRRAPGFTAVAVLTLGIGIGGTTAIFSVVDAMLLRPLPFREPDRLLRVGLVMPPRDGEARRDDMVWSMPKYAVFRDEQRVFQSLGLYTESQTTITGGGNAERLRAEEVSAGYFPTLGVETIAGHGFLAEDDAHPGAPKVAVLGHALWTRRFNADSSAIGQTLIVGGNPYTIIGVAPPGFQGLTGRAELWTPIMSRNADELSGAWDHQFSVVARLREGISLEAAKAAVPVLGAAVDAKFSEEGGGRGGRGGRWSAGARELDEIRVDPVLRRSLLIVFGAVAFVLLIACANIANLMIGRAAARRREIGVRLAIGAGRGRLIRQMLTESALLAALGGIVGVGIAWFSVRLLGASDPMSVLRSPTFGSLGAVTYSTMRLDSTALTFAVLAVVTTGILFGLLPAVQATRQSLMGALREGAGGASSRGGGPRSSRTRSGLAVAQVALAIVLLTGSGLMLRTLGELLSIDPGFNPRRVLTIRLTIPTEGFSRDSLFGFYDQVLSAMRALPGVNEASLIDCAPATGGCNQTVAAFPDRPLPKGTMGPATGVHWVTPSWFTTMGVRLKSGRYFAETDRQNTPKVVVVNERAARTFWPGENPIGKQVAVFQGGFQNGATVVGVVGDVRFKRVDSLGMPDVYISYQQSPRRGMIIVLRTAGDPLALAEIARQKLRQIAPDMPAYDIVSMEQRVAATLGARRFTAALLGAFAVMALILAAIGIYGVLAFVVAQRTPEIGVRVALGAQRSDVLWLIVRQGLTLAIVGCAIGLVGAAAATRLLGTLLYEVSTRDPVTFGGVIVAIVGTALCASWVPARRAVAIDPTEALRRG